MSFIDRWQHRLRALFRADQVQRERDAELEFHLAVSTMHAEHAGMSNADARALAHRQFGNVTMTKESVRGVSRSTFLDTLFYDVRHAARSLWRSPAYLTGASLILAIGVAAATSVFSIFDTIVRRGMPYPNAERLYLAFEQRGDDGGAIRGPSYLTFLDWQGDSATWRGTVAGMAYVRGRPNWLDGADGAERTIVGSVTPGFFATMGVAPILGRTFRPDEETRAGARVVVLAFDTWRRFFAGDRDVVGRTIDVDSVPTTIIGVMPRGFTFPQWVPGRAGSTSMWIPIAHIETIDPSLMKRGDRADLRVVARVRADADSAQAAIALSAVASRLAAAYPESRDWNAVGFLSVRDGALGNVSQILRALAGAVALMLLLACANVANLTFVRGAARARELTIRATLGASGWRVVRQLLTESLGVAFIGCLAGLALTTIVLAGVRRFATNELTGVEHLQIDALSLAFAVGAAFVASIVSALVPAFRAGRAATDGVVRSGTHSATATTHDIRIRSVLVVAQLAIAVVLLVGTALFARSLQRIAQIPLGFEPRHLVATAITPPAKYASAEDALALYQAVLERTRTIPGVTHAAFINHAPLGFGGMPTTVVAEGRDVRDDIGSNVAPFWRTVSAEYAATMQMEMAAGRWFTDDDMRTRDAFVLNETFARQLFPNETAIGRRIVARRAARARPDFGQQVAGTVIGVVRDVRSQSPDAPAPAEVYAPYTLETWPWGTLVVRTTDVPRTIELLRDALDEIDPGIPEARAAAAFNGPGAMLDRLVSMVATRRLLLVTVGVFAAAALLLAAIGLYAVMSYGVAQRTREVGVRVALGATNGSIARMVIGEGTRLALIGTAVGIAGALAATRLIRTLLFDTPTTDIAAYLITTVVLLATATLACYIPARRAAALSPVEAIKGE